MNSGRSSSSGNNWQRWLIGAGLLLALLSAQFALSPTDPDNAVPEVPQLAGPRDTTSG